MANPMALDRMGLGGFGHTERGNAVTMEHRLPHTEAAPQMARGLARDFVSGRLTAEQADDFILMLSEIVSNAVRYGGPEDDGRIGLRLEAEGPVVRAVVSDDGPAFGDADAEKIARAGASHLGLFLVGRLAYRWGRELDGRKAVWFEVEAERGPSGPQALREALTTSAQSP
jgi:anti-sigma regulatory factor (Ser/Thr protein kinase)